MKRLLNRAAAGFGWLITMFVLIPALRIIRLFVRPEKWQWVRK